MGSIKRAQMLGKFDLPEELKSTLNKCKSIVFPDSRKELLDIAIGGVGCDYFEVSYDVPGKGIVTEANVAKCKNGLVVNYTDPYMRRRDPNCMVIADKGETDKPRYNEKFGCEFDNLREMTFEWLSEQRLILMPFMAGGNEFGYPALLVAPDNAGFFAGG